MTHPKKNSSQRAEPIRPELLRLAEVAVERKKIEEEMLAKMCEPCRKVYIEAWAKALAAQSVAMGEMEYGPDYRSGEKK